MDGAEKVSPPDGHLLLKIVGQKFELIWPQRWPGVCTALVWITAVCSAICIVVYFVTVLASAKNLNAIQQIVSGFHAAEYNAEGTPSGREIQLVYHFWTPDKNTKWDVARNKNLTNASTLNPEEFRDRIEPYYWVSDDEREISQWIATLKGLNVVGFSFWEVTGLATAGLKRGYLWDVTTSQQHPISREVLIELYSEQWHRSNNIYLEEYHVRSSHENR